VFVCCATKLERCLKEDIWSGTTTPTTTKLNALNNELQGKHRHLPHMISAVNAFKAKLGVWNRQLKNGRLTHFKIVVCAAFVSEILRIIF